MPVNSTKLYWTLNGHEITAGTVIDNFSFSNVSQSRQFLKFLHHSRQFNNRHNKRHRKRSYLSQGHYTILNNSKLNMTRLTINELSEAHKGVYRCQYDKIETEFHLDYLTNGNSIFS